MIEMKVEGLRELNQMLMEFPVKVEKKVLRSALREGAKVIRDDAKRNVYTAKGPYKVYEQQYTKSSGKRGKVKSGKKWVTYNPGTVAKNIIVFAKRKRGYPRGVSAISVGVRPKVWFAQFLEFGSRHSKMAPTRFLSKALYSSPRKVLDIFKDALYRFIQVEYYRGATGLRRTNIKDITSA
jgi:HK97 gp10 family phage protein